MLFDANFKHSLISYSLNLWIFIVNGVASWIILGNMNYSESKKSSSVCVISVAGVIVYLHTTGGSVCPLKLKRFNGY